MRLAPASLAGRLLLFLILPLYLTIGFGQTITYQDAQAELHIDPLRFLATIVWAWNPNVLLGTHTGFNHVYNTPYTWLYVLLALLHLPDYFAQLTVMFVIYLTVGWCMFVGVGMLAPALPDYARLAAAAAFSCNVYVAFNSQGSTPMLLAYAAIPLFVGLTAAVARGTLGPLNASIALAFTVFAGCDFNPPLVVIDVCCAILAAIVFLITHPSRLSALRRLIAFGALSGIATVLLNAYWIGPFLDYMRTVWLGGILDESPMMHNADTTFANVLRGLGQWSIFHGDDRGPWFPWSSWYAIGLFAGLLWVVPILSATALVMRRMRFAFLAPLIIVLVSVPLVTGYYEGNPVAKVTSALYAWAYVYLPLFQMFRSVYKWVGPLEFGFAALYGMAVVTAVAYARRQLSYPQGLIRASAAVLFCGIPMLVYLPVTIEKANRATQHIPKWVETERNVSVPGDGRLAVLPGQYLESYLWGDPTYFIEDSTFRQSLLYGYLGSAPNEAGDQWMKSAYRRFRGGDPTARALFEFLGAREVVDRRDFRQRGNFAFGPRSSDADPSTTAALLRQLRLRPSLADGANVYYPLPTALPRLYTVKRTRLFPGPSLSFADAPTAESVLRGDTFLMGDDLSQLSDRAAFSAIDRDDERSDASDLRLSLAPGARRFELQSPESIFRVPRDGVYEVALANAAALFPELPQNRLIELDGIPYTVTFGHGAWQILGPMALARGVHHVNAPWLTPASAIVLTCVPIGSQTGQVDRLLAEIPRGTTRRASESGRLRMAAMFRTLNINPQWPYSTPLPLRVRHRAVGLAKFDIVSPGSVFSTYPISERWATRPELYQWNASYARSAVAWTTATKLRVEWSGRRPVRASLVMEMASLGKGVLVGSAPQLHLEDWTGAEPGYPQRLSIPVHLHPGMNDIPLAVSGPTLMMGLQLDAPDMAAIQMHDTCQISAAVQGVILSIPRAAASCRVGLVGRAGKISAVTAHLEGEVHTTRPLVGADLAADVRTRDHRVLHLEWPIGGNFDIPVFSSLPTADAEQADSVTYSLVLKRQGAIADAGLQVVKLQAYEQADLRMRAGTPPDLVHPPALRYKRRDPVDLDVILPPSAEGRWLVFAEAFHPEWRASIGPRRLDHIAVDGFMNGWYVPASRGPQHVGITFEAQRLYRITALISIFSALTMLACVLAPRLKAAK